MHLPSKPPMLPSSPRSPPLKAPPACAARTPALACSMSEAGFKPRSMTLQPLAVAARAPRVAPVLPPPHTQAQTPPHSAPRPARTPTRVDSAARRMLTPTPRVTSVRAALARLPPPSHGRTFDCTMGSYVSCDIGETVQWFRIRVQSEGTVTLGTARVPRVRKGYVSRSQHCVTNERVGARAQWRPSAVAARLHACDLYVSRRVDPQWTPSSTQRLVRGRFLVGCAPPVGTASYPCVTQAGRTDPSTRVESKIHVCRAQGRALAADWRPASTGGTFVATCRAGAACGATRTRQTWCRTCPAAATAASS